MHMGYLSLSSHLKNVCRVCTEFDSGEVLGQVQSLNITVPHPSGDHTRSIMLNLASESECSHSVPPTIPDHIGVAEAPYIKPQLKVLFTITGITVCLGLGSGGGGGGVG